MTEQTNCHINIFKKLNKQTKQIPFFNACFIYFK